MTKDTPDLAGFSEAGTLPTAPGAPVTPTLIGAMSTWKVSLFFFLCAALMLAAHQGERMSYAYPALALLAGLWAYYRSPASYIVFTFLLFFLTPLVRRIADYQSSYRDPSPIVAAPLIVSFICVLALPKMLGMMFSGKSRALLPFGTAVLAVAYGLGIGFLKSHPNELVRPTLEWLSPLVLGAYCCLKSRDYDLIPLVARLCLGSIIFMSVYGVIQFVAPFPWDIYWLQGFNSTHFQPSFGLPERFGIRLFSTLNAPQTFAALLAFTFPSILATRSTMLSLIATPLAMVALLLTQSRSQLLSVLLIFVVLLVVMRARILPRLGLLAGVLVVCASLGSLSPEIVNKVSDRLDSFNNLKSDDSAISRKLGMNLALHMVVEEPFGQGIGFPDGPLFERSDLSTHYGVDTHDLGIVEVALSFGYLGGFLYIGGFVYALFRMIGHLRTGSSDDTTIVVAIIASLGCMLTVNLFLGLPGIWLWCMMGMVLERRDRVSSEAAAAMIDPPSQTAAPTIASECAV